MQDNNLVRAEQVPPELMEKLQQQFPDMKIVCAGDVSEIELPEGVQQALEALAERHHRSLSLGRCLDCDQQMSGFPQTPSEAETWSGPPKGWTWFNDAQGEIVAFQCPECDAADHDEDDTDLYIPSENE